MKKETPPFYILTGGPGSGKTSVLEELKKIGFSVVLESGRKLIQEQVNCDSDALPWKDKKKFRDLLLNCDMEKYKECLLEKNPIFFDRGIPDSIGYSYLESLPVSNSLLRKIKDYPYQKTVFIFPPWEEIYVNDAERKQSFQKAVATYETIKETYQNLGYTVIEIKKTSIKERVQMILLNLVD